MPMMQMLAYPCSRCFGDVVLVSQFLLFLASDSYERCSGISVILHSQPFVEQLLAIRKALGWETLRSGLVTPFKNTTSANISEYRQPSLQVGLP